jgi:hypothetical protein
MIQVKNISTPIRMLCVILFILGYHSNAQAQEKFTDPETGLILTITDSEMRDCSVTGWESDGPELNIRNMYEYNGIIYHLYNIAENAISSTQLRSLYITCNFQSFSDYAFYGCPNIETIVMYEANDVAPTLGNNVFVDEVYENAIVYFTEEDTYKYAIKDDSWSKFQHIVYGDIDGDMSGDSTANVIGYYTDDTGICYNIYDDGTCAVSGYEGDDTDVYIPYAVNYQGNSYTVTAIGEHSFLRKQIETISIPDGVTKIEANAFMNCDALTTINFPDGVTKIGNYAFYNCSALTTIDFPDGLKQIGEYAFFNCSAITQVVIPDSVTKIGNYAFYRCNDLNTVTLGSGVTSLGDYSFYSDNIRIVISKASTAPTMTYDTAFTYYTYNEAKLYIPDSEEAEESYRSTADWYNFQNIVRGLPQDLGEPETDNNDSNVVSELNSVVSDNADEIAIYTISGTKLYQGRYNANAVNNALPQHNANLPHLNPGLYIVTLNNRPHKVAVK